MGLSGVTQASKRVGLKAEKDKNFGKLLKRIEENIICELCRSDPNGAPRRLLQAFVGR